MIKTPNVHDLKLENMQKLLSKKQMPEARAKKQVKEGDGTSKDSKNINEKNLQRSEGIKNKREETAEEKEIKRVTQDFESLLIGEMFKVMRKSVGKVKLMSGGYGEEMFQSMLDAEFSKELSKRDMLGISDMLERELLGRLNASGSGNQRFSMPAIGKLTSGFGMRTHPITKEEAHHDGIDIALKEGTPIRASMGGEVTFSGEMKGYGKIIIVKHGEYETRYAHCSELLYKKGDRIKSGEEIAKSGNTGVSTGPHLHFEIRHKNKPVDPFSMMK